MQLSRRILVSGIGIKQVLEARAIHIHSDLIERAVRNERAAQFELYKKYNKAMYNTALRITKSTSLAEDAVQESFISAFQSLVFYRGEASFGSWLKRIVINKAITLSKKENRWEFETDDVAAQLPEVEESESEYSVEEVKRAIEQLPDGFRTVLSMYLLEGYDHQEISEILDISESTSKTQYKRAKEKLRMLLKK